MKTHQINTTWVLSASGVPSYMSVVILYKKKLSLPPLERPWETKQNWESEKVVMW